MVLHVAFNLSLVWRDSRITFYNLKDDHTLNVLPGNGSLWVPNIAFTNTLNNDGTVLDEKTSIFALKEVLSGRDVPHLPEEGTCY